MKMSAAITFLVVLLVAWSNPCPAAIWIKEVSPKEAKALDMEVGWRTLGEKQVRVELAFKTEGELKGYSYVQLWIQEGEDILLVATLKEKQNKVEPGQVVVSFTVGRAMLEKTSLLIVKGQSIVQSGYQLSLKDFVDLETER